MGRLLGLAQGCRQAWAPGFWAVEPQISESHVHNTHKSPGRAASAFVYDVEGA